jgi:glycerol kinase
LKSRGFGELVTTKTGLVIDSYFSASKIKWIFDNVRDTYQRALKGDLLFGTIDTWLLWNLSGGQAFYTDYSNASRTMLYNIYEKCWDPELLELLNIPYVILPEVKDSSTIFAYTTKENFFGFEIPISGIAGDQQAALFGQTCWQAGQAKNTYGTGCFLLMNTKDKAIKSKHGLLTTLAWGIEGEIDYALEGSIFVGGSAIQWLRDGLKLIKNASDTQAMAYQVADDQEIYLVPAFVGLGAPYWNDEVAGALFGLTRATTAKHLAKATLESIAYQTKDIINAMEKDANLRLTYLGVDGGACANDYLMQFQSDILAVPVERKTVRETTALGAAYLAGLATGYFKDRDAIKNAISIEKVFIPAMSEAWQLRKYKKWQMAVEATCKFIV